MRQLLIGITGSLGSGKTTVAGYFKNLGAQVIDADTIAHCVLLNKKVREKITSTFGGSLLKNNRIDRRALAKIVFSNRNKLGKLCRIIQPPILKKIRQNKRLMSCKS